MIRREIKPNPKSYKVTFLYRGPYKYQRSWGYRIVSGLVSGILLLILLFVLNENAIKHESFLSAYAVIFWTLSYLACWQIVDFAFYFNAKK